MPCPCRALCRLLRALAGCASALALVILAASVAVVCWYLVWGV